MSGGEAAVRVEALEGSRLTAALPDLAALRIAVFRDYPYLYDGTLDYETDYLREFAAADGAVLIAATAGERMVGASTASPMAAQKPEIRGPFEARGHDVGAIFYFGESVLLPDWRGRGIGHAFFDQREAAARRRGATTAAFASVVRPDDHPLRPAAYRSNDAFWRGRGYRPVDGLVTSMTWQDLGEATESVKTMQFWMRAL